MAVRRLAEDAVQPHGFKFNSQNSRWAKDTIKKYPDGREASAIIPLMMRAQEQEGWVTKASIEAIAEMLGMPYIRALEVATFYTQFQLKPVGTKAHVQVCGTTPCMLRGSEDLMAVCKSKISQNQFETNADGTLSWEEVECQGACVNAPMVMIFKDTYEDLTPERLAEIIDEFEADRGERVTPGPQIDRIYSAAEGGPTTLTEPVSRTKAARKPAAAKTPAPKAKAAGATGKGQPKVVRAATASKPKAKPEAKASTKSAGPVRLAKPEGNADDLKLISGVGPKLEKTLNGLGFWHFSQIAKWTKQDVAVVDDQLTFKGRIVRDEWITQAKVLAKGGK